MWLTWGAPNSPEGHQWALAGGTRTQDQNYTTDDNILGSGVNFKALSTWHPSTKKFTLQWSLVQFMNLFASLYSLS